VNGWAKDGTVPAEVVKWMVAELTSTPYTKVKEFHETYGQPVGDKPQFLTEDRMALRKRLIEEEYAEFLEAVEEGDLVNAFKELADLIYVVEGTIVEMGGDGDAVFNEVHRSNMSKLDENGKAIFREDGKVLKGPYYFEADVASVLGL
jgi:predicted HAD superfamily Cof-like phosphohydrolase